MRRGLRAILGSFSAVISRARSKGGGTNLDDVHGKRVKEFVSDEHGKDVVAVGDLVEGVVP